MNTATLTKRITAKRELNATRKMLLVDLKAADVKWEGSSNEEEKRFLSKEMETINKWIDDVEQELEQIHLIN